MTPDFRPPRMRDFLGLSIGMALAALFVGGSMAAWWLLFKGVS